MRSMKYADIIARNRELADVMRASLYSIGVLSNLITSQLNEILECVLRERGVNASAASGDFDNIVQDSERFGPKDLVVIFWEAANLIEGLFYKSAVMDPTALEEVVLRTKSEVDLVFRNLRSTPLVVVNEFSAFPFSRGALKSTALASVCEQLNEHLRQAASSNVRIVEIDKVFGEVGYESAFDFRYFYSSRALYSSDFYKAYAEHIAPLIFSIQGMAKKALIFDCDNTLWGGVVGEDGMDGIEVSASSKKGIVFQEVQHIALDLARRGVIVGICSKNEASDVDEVLREHPDMVLRDADLVIKKVNWNDKAQNLREIAAELNIGIDSIVFVDDSAYELNLVRELAPEVTVVEVPRKLFDYPRVMRDTARLFHNNNESAEDAQRVRMYKQGADRDIARQHFGGVTEYLASLQLRVTINEDDLSQVARVAQLTSKTNQFNLTTRRYSDAAIDMFMRDDAKRVFVCSIADKFGDYGLTAVCIVDLDQAGKTARIDSLLMSCRVIGRNVEKAILDTVLERLAAAGVESVEANFIQTKKNGQVANFYEQSGFAVVEQTDSGKRYQIAVHCYEPACIDYIEVLHG